jgi:hypothetical protein
MLLLLKTYNQECEEPTTKPDLSDPQTYRLVGLENGTDKIKVQSKIDENSWCDEKEVASVAEGNKVIHHLLQERSKQK